MDLVLQPFDWLPFGSGEKTSGHTMDLVCQVYVYITSSDDSRVDGDHVCWKSVIEPSFNEDGATA